MEAQIEQLYRPLFLYVRKRISNHEDAEDLTQEVFYKLAKSLNDDVNNLKNWVYTIAKNTITDYYRKKKVLLEDLEGVSFSEEIAENTAAEELSTCVSRFIQELPEEYRSIMILSELEGVPQKEIAEQMGINYVTVRSKVQRGRKKLKVIFTDCCTIKQGGKGSIMSYHKNPPPKVEEKCCEENPK